MFVYKFYSLNIISYNINKLKLLNNNDQRQIIKASDVVIFQVNCFALNLNLADNYILPISILLIFTSTFTTLLLYLRVRRVREAGGYVRLRRLCEKFTEGVTQRFVEEETDVWIDTGVQRSHQHHHCVYTACWLCVRVVR